MPALNNKQAQAAKRTRVLAASRLFANRYLQA